MAKPTLKSARRKTLIVAPAPRMERPIAEAGGSADEAVGDDGAGEPDFW